MKQILITLGLALVTANASAGTVCNVNKSTQRDSTFDQILYSSEVDGPLVLIFDEKQTKVEPIDFSQIQTSEGWQKIEGRLFVALAKYENGLYTASVGKVDLSNMKGTSIAQILAAGTPELGKPLTLVLLDHQISVGCFKLP